MTRSFRSFLPVSAFVLVLASPLAAREAGPIAGGDSLRITAAANVTLRTLPSPGADAVAQLPLGTEVVNAGPAGLDKTWIRVKLGDAREGWVLASLTKPLDPAWRWADFRRHHRGPAGPQGRRLPGVRRTGRVHRTRGAGVLGSEWTRATRTLAPARVVVGAHGDSQRRGPPRAVRVLAHGAQEPTSSMTSLAADGC